MNRRELVKDVIGKFGESENTGKSAFADMTMHFHQKKPYTCVVVSYHGDLGEAVGVGFSKVRWPDRWNAERGYDIALGKAAQHVAEQLL